MYIFEEKKAQPVVFKNVSADHFENKRHPPSFFSKRQDTKHVFLYLALHVSVLLGGGDMAGRVYCT